MNDTLTTEEFGRLFHCGIYGDKNRRTVGGPHLGDEIAAALDGCGGTVFEPFCGSAFVGATLKRRGWRIVSNDVRREANLRAMALVGNNCTTISVSDLAALEAPPDDSCGWFRRWYGAILGRENAEYYDLMAANLHRLPDATKRAIVATGLLWVFGTLTMQVQNLHVARCRRWLNGNRHCPRRHTRDVDLREDLRAFLFGTHPRLLFDNGMENPCHRENCVALAPRVEANAMYADWPYAGAWSDYGSAYAVFEKWAQALEGRPPEDPYLGADLPPHASFRTARRATDSLDRLMAAAAHIPLWVLSWGASPSIAVTVEEVAQLAEGKGREVEIRRFQVRRAKSAKVFGWECLVVCRARDGRSEA